MYLLGLARHLRPLRQDRAAPQGAAVLLGRRPQRPRHLLRGAGATTTGYSLVLRLAMAACGSSIGGDKKGNKRTKKDTGSHSSEKKAKKILQQFFFTFFSEEWPPVSFFVLLIFPLLSPPIDEPQADIINRSTNK
eukprot:2256169-Pyramimonas_sp.AAC.1